VIMFDLTWLIVIASVAGTIANACHKRWGFVVWIVGNLFWIPYNLYLGVYAQVVLGAIYLASAIFGYLKWPKEKNK